MTTKNECQPENSHWFYKNTPLTVRPEGKIGFVYIIENLLNNKKYLGKKKFLKTAYYQVKGKRKKKLVDNDWLSYYGSNDMLLEDVKTHGTENFRRTILYLCDSAGEMSYYEAKLQFEHDVLLKEEYYNTWIMVRTHRKHLKKLQECPKQTLTNP